MTGSIYIRNHNFSNCDYGQTHQVRCIKVPEGKEKDGLSYAVGETYTCQKQTPRSDDWIVVLASRNNLHDGFSFSWEFLMEHFEFIEE